MATILFSFRKGLTQVQQALVSYREFKMSIYFITPTDNAKRKGLLKLVMVEHE